MQDTILIVQDSAVGAAGAVLARRASRTVFVVHPDLTPQEVLALFKELLEE